MPPPPDATWPLAPLLLSDDALVIAETGAEVGVALVAALCSAAAETVDWASVFVPVVEVLEPPFVLEAAEPEPPPEFELFEPLELEPRPAFLLVPVPPAELPPEPDEPLSEPDELPEPEPLFEPADWFCFTHQSAVPGPDAVSPWVSS